jgi:hypothetical protein
LTEIFVCMYRDYRPMAHQDVYDPENIDDDVSVSDISIGGRMDLEAEMRRRDRAEGRTKTMRRGLLYG